MLTHYPILDRNNEVSIFKNMKIWRDKYYKYYDYCHSQQNINNLCKDYLESLLWTSTYYFKGCKDWRYYYSHIFAPSIKDFYNFIKDINNLKDYVKINHNSYDIYDCLELVLPNESMKLHPYKDKKTKDSNNYTIKTLFKRYLWECE